jgi:hypothetical protein
VEIHNLFAFCLNRAIGKSFESELLMLEEPCILQITTPVFRILRIGSDPFASDQSANFACPRRPELKSATENLPLAFNLQKNDITGVRYQSGIHPICRRQLLML